MEGNTTAQVPLPPNGIRIITHNNMSSYAKYAAAQNKAHPFSKEYAVNFQKRGTKIGIRHVGKTAKTATPEQMRVRKMLGITGK